jgi:putative transposase
MIRGIISPKDGPRIHQQKLIKWAENHGVAILHIRPRHPQQNADIQRCNQTVRHEWPDQHIIESIDEAKGYATQWL